MTDKGAFANASAERNYERHEEASPLIASDAREVFDFLDDHRNLSSHMGSGSRSPMMGVGEMELELDSGQGKSIGSHIVMRGRAFGFQLYVDEVIVEREVGVKKTWQTFQDRLVVIGAYQLGFFLEPLEGGCRLTVWIRYDLPSKRRWLGRLGGGMYARWCVQQMLRAARRQFQ